MLEFLSFFFFRRYFLGVEFKISQKSLNCVLSKHCDLFARARARKSTRQPGVDKFTPGPAYEALHFDNGGTCFFGLCLHLY